MQGQVESSFSSHIQETSQHQVLTRGSTVNDALIIQYTSILPNYYNADNCSTVHPILPHRHLAHPSRGRRLPLIRAFGIKPVDGIHASACDVSTFSTSEFGERGGTRWLTVVKENQGRQDQRYETKLVQVFGEMESIHSRAAFRARLDQLGASVIKDRGFVSGSRPLPFFLPFMDFGRVLVALLRTASSRCAIQMNSEIDPNDREMRFLITFFNLDSRCRIEIERISNPFHLFFHRKILSFRRTRLRNRYFDGISYEIFEESQTEDVILQSATSSDLSNSSSWLTVGELVQQLDSRVDS